MFEMCGTRLAEYAGPKSRQKLPSGHHRTTLSGYIFATKAHIDNRKKKLVKQQYVHKMSPQYGEQLNIGPTAEIGPVVLGIPGNFNGCRVLTALLHGSQVVSISQTLQH